MTAVELFPCHRHAGVFHRALMPGGGRGFDWCVEIADDCPECEVTR